jgi:hypothetical protein
VCYDILESKLTLYGLEEDSWRSTVMEGSSWRVHITSVFQILQVLHWNTCNNIYQYFTETHVTIFINHLNIYDNYFNNYDNINDKCFNINDNYFKTRIFPQTLYSKTTSAGSACD